ncbi:MAG: peptide deformylase [Firmicutes bacterium]|nr:peptide deformylase [Bacillota bacterium]
MIRELVHDPIFLAQKSEPATREDMDVAFDLKDTLYAYQGSCVGMAANMIGVLKRIIIFDDGDSYGIMFNPEIIEMAEPYETEEGCLSLLGDPRPVTRYNKIKVKWHNPGELPKTEVFTGFTAEIIQHEVDHCNGVLI